MDWLNNIHWQSIIISLPAIIIGLTFHEYAHGWAAYKLGDLTAKSCGRLTLNPLAHLDPIGFLALLLCNFGWAKPVPINPLNFQGNRKTGLILVSLAGPLSNLLLAIIFGLLLHLLQNQPFLYDNQAAILLLLEYCVLINVILAVFNLIPIPPLDGSKILFGLIPGYHNWMLQLERYGFIILLVLMFSGIFGTFIHAAAYPIYGLLSPTDIFIKGYYTIPQGN